jgi:hypothetical protein
MAKKNKRRSSRSQPAVVSPSFEPSTRSREWYESNMLWGSLGLFATILLAVAAATVKDLRWLLWIAWPCGSLFAWALTRSFLVGLRRWLTAFAGSLVVGFGLLWLNSALKPQASNQASRVETGTTSPKVTPAPAAASPDRTPTFDSEGYRRRTEKLSNIA